MLQAFTDTALLVEWRIWMDRVGASVRNMCLADYTLPRATLYADRHWWGRDKKTCLQRTLQRCYQGLVFASLFNYFKGMDKKPWRRKLKDSWSKEMFLPQNNCFKNILQAKKFISSNFICKAEFVLISFNINFFSENFTKHIKFQLSTWKKKSSIQYTG